MTSSFLKLCTAAIAGSIIGIAYERFPPISSWPDLTPQAVSAASSIIPKNDKLTTHDEHGHKEPFKMPDVDPSISGENLKHSARFGLPSKDNLRIFNDFVLSYDRRLRAPNWVFEHLTPDKLKQRDNSDRDRSKFQEDFAIHPYFRSRVGDFTNTGFDRGHMAAAGNHKLSQDNLDQTFVLSNIVPQLAAVNRGPWERLETYVRWRANRAKNLYVVSGPLYLPMKARDGNLYVTYRVLGNNHVSVPTHFFKVFLVETKDNNLEVEAFVMPNDDSMNKDVKLDDCRVALDRLDTIERSSGVIFFDQLSREKLIAPNRLAEGYKEIPRPSERQKKLLNKPST